VPRLNKITLVDRRYAQTFVSKSEDFSIAPELAVDEQVLDVNVANTYPEVECITIDQDCNWFLASGVIPQTIPSCQLGVINPLDAPAQPENLSVIFPGSVTYEVRPGKIMRQGFKSLADFILTPTAPAPCDSFYENVLALMPMKTNTLEVKNNLNVFTVTATINNNGLDPFGNAGVLQFNGNQSFRLASSTLDLTSDFAIEMWFKPTGFLASGGIQPGIKSSTIIETRVDSQNTTPFNCYFLEDLSVGMGWVNSVSSVFSAPNKVILNAYNYLCIARVGSTVTLKLNGETLLLINTSQNLSSNNVDWYIGGFKPSPPFDFKGLVGFMAGFRVSNIYREGSIVPTTPFGQIVCPN
jgi:hypothetical protein